MHSYFWKINLLLVGFCLYISSAANAQQLLFIKKSNEESVNFKYKWSDQNKNIESIDFSLSKEALFNRFRHIKQFKPEIATRYVNKRLKKMLQKRIFEDVTAQLVKEGDKSTVVIKGNDPVSVNVARQELNKLQETYYQKYLDKNYHQTFVSLDKVDAIKPNHIKFALDSVDDLKAIKPIILNKVSIKNIRKVTDFTLAFIQNIPYSDLLSRVESSGSGYSSPLKVLWENQGDCDSKATLTIALLRALMPRIKIAIVFIEKHALIAIQIRPQGDELTIRINNEHYVLADPTGPQLLPLGQISEASEQAILQGQYFYEVMP